MTIQNPTTNYSWVLPTVGGSTGAWGTLLNTIFGDDGTGSLDSILGDFEDRISTVETTLGSTPSEAVVVRHIVDVSGVMSQPANFLTALCVSFTGSTDANGYINIDLTDVASAGGPTLTDTDFLFWQWIGWRASDKVMLQCAFTDYGAGNSIDMEVRFRDGALCKSTSISARIVLFFDAAPA